MCVVVVAITGINNNEDNHHGKLPFYPEGYKDLLPLECASIRHGFGLAIPDLMFPERIRAFGSGTLRHGLLVDCASMRHGCRLTVPDLILPERIRAFGSGTLRHGSRLAR